MVVFDLVILAGVVLVALFMLTQVFVPLVKGTSLVPLLRTDAQQVKHQLEIARHTTEVRRLEIQLKQEKARAEILEQQIAGRAATNQEVQPEEGTCNGAK